MKVLIDIPEVYYEGLKQADIILSGKRSGKTLESVIYNAVAKGVPVSDTVSKIKTLANFHCKEVPCVCGDETPITEKMLSLYELNIILWEIFENEDDKE